LKVEILNISLLVFSVCVASELMSVQIEDAEAKEIGRK
jgi:hypothetical protein